MLLYEEQCVYFMLLHKKLVECGVGKTTSPLNLQLFELNLQGSFEQFEGLPPLSFLVLGAR